MSKISKWHRGFQRSETKEMTLPEDFMTCDYIFKHCIKVFEFPLATESPVFEAYWNNEIDMYVVCINIGLIEEILCEELIDVIDVINFYAPLFKLLYMDKNRYE